MLYMCNLGRKLCGSFLFSFVSKLSTRYYKIKRQLVQVMDKSMQLQLYYNHNNCTCTMSYHLWWYEFHIMSTLQWAWLFKGWHFNTVSTEMPIFKNFLPKQCWKNVIFWDKVWRGPTLYYSHTHSMMGTIKWK